MITVKTTDLIRIELDEPNGRSVTLTGAQWLAIFDLYKNVWLESTEEPMAGLKDIR